MLSTLGFSESESWKLELASIASVLPPFCADASGALDLLNQLRDSLGQQDLAVAGALLLSERQCVLMYIYEYHRMSIRNSLGVDLQRLLYVILSAAPTMTESTKGGPLRIASKASGTYFPPCSDL